MLNVLIISSNLNTTKQIINNIVSSVSNLKIIGVANTLVESKNILLKYEPEFIITTNKELFNFIVEKFITYSPGIIFISNTNESNDIVYKNYLVLDSRLKFKTMIERINYFINKKISINKKERAIKILSEIGFDFKWSGTNYLLDSIMYANSYKGSYSFDNLYRDVYSYVAEINNTNSNIIKWAILRAVRYLYDKGTKDTYLNIEKYFGVKYPERITPKLIINIISNTLSY